MWAQSKKLMQTDDPALVKVNHRGVSKVYVVAG